MEPIVLKSSSYAHQHASICQDVVDTRQKKKSNRDGDIVQSVHRHPLKRRAREILKRKSNLESLNRGEEKKRPSKKVRSATKQDAAWDLRYEELKRFKSHFGHCNVPGGIPSNPQLGRWVHAQRYQYKCWEEGRPSKITEERIQKLDEIDFAWKAKIPNHEAWNRRYEELKQFKAHFGHCDVPENIPSNPQLRSWVNYQRRQYRFWKEGKPSPITEERIQKLDQIGFTWQAKIHICGAWDQHYEELKQFKAQFGHCNVPRNFPVNLPLGGWVHGQRYQYKCWKEGKLSYMNEERIQKLDKIGFAWKSNVNLQDHATWNQRYEELKQFKACYRHCNVPQKFAENPSLGIWVQTQRRQYKCWKEGKPSHMTEERMQALDRIGFAWQSSSQKSRLQVAAEAICLLTRSESQHGLGKQVWK